MFSNFDCLSVRYVLLVAAGILSLREGFPSCINVKILLRLIFFVLCDEVDDFFLEVLDCLPQFDDYLYLFAL